MGVGERRVGGAEGRGWGVGGETVEGGRGERVPAPYGGGGGRKEEGGPYQRGRDPTSNRRRSAILLCRSHLSMATAIMSPPRKSMLVSVRYLMAACFAVSTPRAGRRTRGRRAVTARGTASVIQYTAIRSMT